MASSCEVVLSADSAEQAAHWAAQAMQEVWRIEQRYSRYRDNSIVSRINAAAGGEPVACDAETLSLLQFADQMHRQSEGLFDITSGVLRRAWNFKQVRLPDAAAIDALLALVGWDRVERQGELVRLPQAGMELDFGGFGKEYAADRAAALLQAQGVTSGYVNLGGDLRAMGPRPDGSPWQIGIQHPRQRERLLATQQLGTGGLATSGDYERYIDIGGHRYCHILHPRTGWPVRHWQTVSVTAPLAVLAGCVCTMAMLKEEQGLAFLEASGCAFLAMDTHGHIYKH